MTVDFDFLSSDPRILDPETWRTLEHDARLDVRRGDADDPVAGVAHLQFTDGAEVDVLLARWKWEAAVIERAERLDLGGFVVAVPTTSDLVLLKLAAGGPLDLQDVIALVRTDPDRIVREVDDKVGSVLPDVTALWAGIRLSLV